MFYETNLTLAMASSQGRKCVKKITGICTSKIISNCVGVRFDSDTVLIQLKYLNKQEYLRTMV